MMRAKPNGLARARQRAWMLVLGFLLATATACESEDQPSPHLTSTAPSVSEQGRHLVLLGTGFGDYEPTRSAVFVDGSCADVMGWETDRVDVVVPTGVGIGARVVVLVRSDGARGATTLQLQGRDLPATRRACEGLLQGTVQDAVDDTRDETHAPDTAVPDAISPGTHWRYVRIEDLSDNAIGRNPGADIDAVLLYTSAGRISAAQQVIAYTPFPMFPELADPDEALGEPDAFTYYPDLSWCDIYDGTVALGGAGYLWLDMGWEIQTGDQLEIFERGGCFYAPELTSLPEAFLVSVGRADGSDPDAIEWVEIGEGEGPVGRFVVGPLPP